MDNWQSGGENEDPGERLRRTGDGDPGSTTEGTDSQAGGEVESDRAKQELIGHGADQGPDGGTDAGE